jgi:hypothetical protein
MKSFKQYFNEHIVKTKSGYKLVSKSTGKNLGTSSSLSGIKRREQQVQYFKHVNEDGMGAGAVAAGPTNTVGGVAGTGDSRLDPSQREPGVSKKRNPTLGYFRRKPPKA